MKRILSLILILVMLTVTVSAQTRSLSPGQVGGDWTVLLLARSAELGDGFSGLDRETADNYYLAVCELVSAKDGELHKSRSSEYSRVILALGSIGRDARNVGGYDLTERMLDLDFVTRQGVNGAAWALLALNSLVHSQGSDELETMKATLVRYILDEQSGDGRFIEDVHSAVDYTAMAITALAYYASDSITAELEAEIDCAIAAGVDYLASRVNSNGGFATRWGEVCETSAQVLLALDAVGAADDERFGKVYTNLMSYSVAEKPLSLEAALSEIAKGEIDSLFAHTKGGKADMMATEQALLALTALELDTPIFDFSGIGKATHEPDKRVGLPGKSPDVKVPAATVSQTLLTDLTPDCESAVRVLAARGIVTGYSDDTYKPEQNLTRAEFCTLIVRALGLKATNESNAKFTDVPEGVWFADAVNTASEYGLVNGIGGGLFNPSGNITREQAAVICARAAKLCGHDSSRTSSAIRNSLSVFSDYMKSSDFARESLAFCIDYEMLDADAIKLRPLDNITRGEAAILIYRLLTSSKLI